jgi:hypothetical protein
MRIGLLIGWLVWLTPALAAAADRSLSVTIYADDLALVRTGAISRSKAAASASSFKTYRRKSAPRPCL